MKLRQHTIKTFLIGGILILLSIGTMECSSTFSVSWKSNPKGASTPTPDRFLQQNKDLPTKSEKRLLCQEKHPSQKTYRSFSIQITRLPYKNVDALKGFLAELRKENVHRVFLRVFQRRGDAYFHLLPIHAPEGVYFKTPHAPMVSNLLPIFCRLAHREGIKVYAWMTTLSSDFLSCGKLRHIYKFNPDTSALLRTYRLSPFDPTVRLCLSKIFADLAHTPIDGILIQDDLLLHYNEDFHPLTLATFERRASFGTWKPSLFFLFRRSSRGKMLPKSYTPLFWKWCRWKNDVLCHLTKDLILSVKRINPSIEVGIDLNYEALSSPANALAWYSRSIQKMEEIAHPDFYAVMSYQDQMRRETGKTEQEVLSCLEKMVERALVLVPNPRRWVFKVQTIDWQSRKPFGFVKLKKTLDAIESAASIHTCLMPFTPSLLKKNVLTQLQS